jgi:putative acetyltransferase
MQYLKYTSTQRKPIQELFTQTFTDSESADEGKLIGNLIVDLMTKTDPKDLYIFIAKEQDMIVGGVVFSRIRFEKSSLKTFILSPMAVATQYQKQGIGKSLIAFCHDELKKDKVELVLTYGDINFYGKSGYQQISENQIKAPLKMSYPEGWLGLSLTGQKIPTINEKTNCVEVLNNPVYW